MLLAKQVPGDGLCKADEPRWGVYVFFTLFLVKRTFLGCWWFFYISCLSRNLVEIMYPLKFNENTRNIARYIFPPKKMGGGYLLDVFWVVIPTWFGITTFQWSVITMNGDETAHEFTLPATVMRGPNGITPRKTRRIYMVQMRFWRFYVPTFQQDNRLRGPPKRLGNRQVVRQRAGLLLKTNVGRVPPGTSLDSQDLIHDGQNSQGIPQKICCKSM